MIALVVSVRDGLVAKAAYALALATAVIVLVRVLFVFVVVEQTFYVFDIVRLFGKIEVVLELE